MIDQRQRLIVISLLAVTLSALPAGCRKTKQPQLPAKPPGVVRQEFTGPAEGFPPKVKGRTSVAARPAQESVRLTDAVAVQTRDAALQDQRVRDLLGSRFAYIDVDEIEPEKGQPPATGPLATRVTFFSYANNVAVLVRMNGLQVESATRKDGYQPPEGRVEINEAIALASRDANLRDRLQGLTGHAILTYTHTGSPEYGHRILRVTFRNGDEDVPRYFANVDLTDQKVLSAGTVSQENKEPKP
jgi:hypothetical protein